METKLKATRHGGIALLFVILVMMGCVQTEALLPSAEIQTDSNIDAARFIEILNKQPHQLAAFKEKVKNKHVFYEKTKLYTNADYGLTFFIPYGEEGSSTISGGIYYPVENETTEGNMVTLKDVFRIPSFRGWK
jgi:lipoprotein